MMGIGVQCLPWHKSGVPPAFCLFKEEHTNTLKYVCLHNSSKLDLFVLIPLAHVNNYSCLYLKSYKFGFGRSRNTKDLQVFPHAGDQMPSCLCDQSSSLFWPSTFKGESSSMFLSKCPQHQHVSQVNTENAFEIPVQSIQRPEFTSSLSLGGKQHVEMYFSM